MSGHRLKQKHNHMVKGATALCLTRTGRQYVTPCLACEDGRQLASRLTPSGELPRALADLPDAPTGKP